MTANEYHNYGRKFKVEKMPDGRFGCVGRARGFQPYVLDMIGYFDTRDAAQSALDRWAQRQGLRPIQRASAGTQMMLGEQGG